MTDMKSQSAMLGDKVYRQNFNSLGSREVELILTLPSITNLNRTI